MLEQIKLFGTTDSGGDVTVTATQSVFGYVQQVEWALGTLAAGVDATLYITGASGVQRTLLTLTDANANATYYPKVLDTDNVGAALTTYGYQLADGVLELVIASGGATKTGGCIVTVFS